MGKNLNLAVIDIDSVLHQLLPCSIT